MKHAFCKKCENQVAVQYKVYRTQKGQNLEVVFCPLCNSVMNMSSWVMPREPKQEVIPEPGTISFPVRLMIMLVYILPQSASLWVNRQMNRWFGQYVAGTPGIATEAEVPDFVDSFVTQLAKYAGVTQVKGEPDEIFMLRAIKTMAS